MGIPRGTARLLLDEARRRPFEGSLLELGKMFVFVAPEELDAWAQDQGVELTEAEIRASHHPPLADAGCMDDVSFFRRLGFSEVVSSDVSQYEGADLVMDLCAPAPEELHGTFDVVFEGGTLQHVFDLPQALENISKLLKPGGRVIHGEAPSHNHVDHGFYMFSPSFFQEYYEANGFRVETLRVVEFVPYWLDGMLYSTPWTVYDYSPGSFENLSYGRMGNRQLAIFVVATKLDEAAGETVPQQQHYRDVWAAEGEKLPEDVATSEPPGPKPAGAVHALRRRWKLLREMTLRWGPKKLPPVVARY